ncbi:DeoR/GlpR family DNA-binding transcription regulator [Salsuginibacillus kocurii]|uniref:DeoR/GlpR family DNA-binding transcription regulator n=1 Tax=Salsuginibacillus kocurii TaxID=427078 RepID=UPI000362E31F|nr:DeoR/GlpR family DNA-binding transcription regulator [Salsuginibacillus kocurii]
MNANDRREHITELLKEKQRVEVEELTQRLGVSTMTIRRDLSQLEQEGKLIRTHGGAAAPQTLKGETPYSYKEGYFQPEKKAIAEKAAKLVKENATIVLDSGTTTLELARELKERGDLTIITNDIPIAAELINSPAQVVVAGGELQRHVGAMFGPHTEQLLQTLFVDQFFLGAHAVDIEAGVTAPTMEKARIKQLMMAAAEETWLLTDSSKFKKKAFARVCGLDELEGILTDSGYAERVGGTIHQHLLQVPAREGGKVQ